MALVAGAALLWEAGQLWWRAARGLTDAALKPMRLFHWSNSYLALVFVAAAVDPLLRLTGDVTQSVELLLDEAADAAIRAQWDLLGDAGLPTARRTAPSPHHAPHITLWAGDAVELR